ncbi:MAG TPA: hypothetical protein DEH78_04360, partial [Solibacterales bacterium]|nr:hypothetical protein [Bryobacterales bacterium]
DGAHGWNTEGPRIREIGEKALLMTMHGTFWAFPRTFTASTSAGIAPRSTYLRVVGDFARWGERLVLGCDDTAMNEFYNVRRAKGKIAGPGQSQSNLWFLDPARLSQLGPPIGRGGVWIRDDVKAGVASEPYLFSGYDHRLLHLAHQSAGEVTFRLEVDRAGNGTWAPLRDVTVPSRGYAFTMFAPAERGAWVRISTRQPARQATAFFQYAAADRRAPAPARPRTGGPGGYLWARGEKKGTLLLAGATSLYELDAELNLKPLSDPKLHGWVRQNLAPPAGVLEADAASVLYTDEKGARWRLPKGDPSFDKATGVRISREVSTERDLFNAHGTFYELPANNSGGVAFVRPVTTHNLPITDYCSWRGLTVISGLPEVTLPAGEFIRSTDGKVRLWLGVSDDLWQFGKPVGSGGPWRNTAVKAGQPSDPYLMTGYDRKTLTLSHQQAATVKVRVEIDLTGAGLWV